MIITRLCYGDQTAAATDCWLVAKAAWHEGRCTMLANLRCDDRCWRSTCTELVDYLDLGADLQVCTRHRLNRSVGTQIGASIPTKFLYRVLAYFLADGGFSGWL